jgi:hypothetical protein
MSVSEVMEFTTAPAAEGSLKRTEISFKLDGKLLKAYVPTDTQIAMMYRLTSRTATYADKIAGSIELLQNCLQPASFAHVEARLLDPGDSFDLVPGVGQICGWLSEVFVQHKEGTLPAGQGDDSALAAATIGGPAPAKTKPAAKAAARPAAKPAVKTPPRKAPAKRATSRT